MKKVLAIISAVLVVSMFASCAATRSDCPSHDPNFFRKSYSRVR